MGQKICPEKKLENGFFSKIDVAIVGWHQSFKLELARGGLLSSLSEKIYFLTFSQDIFSDPKMPESIKI